MKNKRLFVDKALIDSARPGCSTNVLICSKEHFTVGPKKMKGLECCPVRQLIKPPLFCSCNFQLSIS